MALLAWKFLEDWSICYARSNDPIVMYKLFTCLYKYTSHVTMAQLELLVYYPAIKWYNTNENRRVDQK